MRARSAIALVASTSVMTSCGVLLGLDDLERVDCLGEKCASSGMESGIDPEGGPAGEGGSKDDGGADGSTTDADADARPPICNGLELWVSFEGASYVAKPGGVSPTVGGGGTPKYSPEARYGIAGAAIGQSGTPDTLTYGTTWNYSKAGTASMWIRKNLGSSCGGTDIVFFSSTIPQKGPRIRCLASSSNLQLAVPVDGGELYTYSTGLNETWSAIPAWNHVVATWETGKARIYLNNSGETGVDYSPQQTDGQPVFGDGTSKPDALYDDLLVWSRALTPIEVNEVKTSVKSIGEVCGF